MNKFSYLLLSVTILAAPAAAQTSVGPTQTPNKTAAAPAAEQRNVPAVPFVKTEDPAPPAAPAADCGCEDGVLPEVLAVVNGVKFGAADLGPETLERVARLQRQVVEARRRELDLQINSILLEAEAKRLGITAQKLIETEVVAKAQEPTGAEARAFYEENKASINRDFASVAADIGVLLRERGQREQAQKFSARLRSAAAVKLLVKEPTPPATPQERARLFATVGDRRVTSADVEDALAPLVSGVRQQVYEARRRALDLRINDSLLAQEAQRRQLTTRALLNAEVETKTPPVTDAQAADFFNQNRDRINGDFPRVKDQVVSYLKDAEAKKLQVAFAERLRKAATVEIFLAAPQPQPQSPPAR